MSSKKSTTGSYSHYSTEILLEAYQQGSQRIAKSIEGLTEDDIKAITIPNKWSIGEIVIHLTDAEIVGSCRFRQIYCEHSGPLPNYEQDYWATNMHYNKVISSELISNIELLSLLRSTTLRILKKCTESDWTKKGFHPERGSMTLREMLELYADHSERHLDQILQRRKTLGKPLSIDLILKDRLY